ncbi:MAG: exodeoxyribonuclease VII small subunit [Desulfovibrio sp.]
MAKTISFEERLERLEGIVEQLEQGDIELEKGVALFKEGLQQTKACGRLLEKARNEVKVLSDGLLKEFDAGNESENAGQE